MKIVHVITGLNNGGAEAVLYRLCTHDRSNSHVVISLMGEGKYGSLLRDAGISLTCINLHKGRITIRGLISLWHSIRVAKADVVQTWMYHSDLVGGIVARLAGVKNICWGIRHSNLTPGTIKKSTRLIAKICAVLSSFIPRKIISCSHAAAAIHQELGYEAKKFCVIPNGYDLSMYTPNDCAGVNIRSELDVDSKVILLGMVARFDPQKDHENLFKALHIFLSDDPDTKLKMVLVGTGMDNQNTELLKLISDYDLRNKILLLGPRSDIPAVMSALDIHVLSSLGEAFPNVLSEAMACGTPCVTTDVGDAALIVGESGWIVSPSNAPELAIALKDAMLAMKNKDSWICRKIAARERIVNNFGIEKMVHSYNVVWRE